MRFLGACLMFVLTHTASALSLGSAVPADANTRPSQIRHSTPCVAGFAGGYPCSNIDLESFFPITAFNMPGLPNPSSGSMIWGHVDSQTGKEYALIAMNNSLAIVELESAAGEARFMGRLPSHTGRSTWRDVRVYRDYAFVTSDSNGAHGMQVLDLRVLRNQSVVPQTYQESAHYAGVTNVHTISINEATGYAYLAGSNLCAGGLHIVDIRTPLNPIGLGCYGTAGYVHEAQCFNYRGPDTEHVGKEICLLSSTNDHVVLDVTQKSAPVELSRMTYPNLRYVHQSWFDEAQRYVLINDELDEGNTITTTHTHIADYADLDNPSYRGFHDHQMPAIDHNLYIRGNYVYQANYTAGLRILALQNLANAQLQEVGFFDVFPANNNTSFNGAWGAYPLLPSGRVIISTLSQGFFVVEPKICTPPAAPSNLSTTSPANQQIALSWNGSGANFQVERALGGCGSNQAPFMPVGPAQTATTLLDTSASGQVNYGYRVRAKDVTGACPIESVSACVMATTTGACTAPPIFSGISSAESAGTSVCNTTLSFSPALASCGGNIQYQIYAAADPLFAVDNASLLTSATMSPVSVAAPFNALRNYVVRAKDLSNGAEDGNSITLSASALGLPAVGDFRTGAELGDPPLNANAPDRSVLAPQHVGWHVDTMQARTGLRSFRSGMGSNFCLTLETDAIALSSGASELRFWQKLATSSGAAGGVLEVQTTPGGAWTRLTPAGGYGATLTSTNGCGFPVATPAFSGAIANWSQVSVDLSSFQNSTVKLRWVFVSNNANSTLTGWFVDDVSISNALVPGICTAATDGVFQNGFE
jgi:choice-of-anchor B domain-containing protein